MSPDAATTWTSFLPGSGIALIGPLGWLVIDGQAPSTDVREAFLALPETRQVIDVLAAVAKDPDVSSFALVTREEEGLRAFLRGSGSVASRDVNHSGTGASTWHEVTIPALASVDLWINERPEDAPTSFACAEGVVAASWLRIPAEALTVDESADVRVDVRPETDPVLAPESTEEIGQVVEFPVSPDAVDAAADDEAPAASEAADPGATLDAEAAGYLTGESRDVDSDPNRSVGGSPVVWSRSCTGGHANAPHASECRVCRASLDGTAATRIQRPLLGRLVFSDGQVVDVDAPVFVGRAPSSTQRGTQIPTTVTVRGSDISRTHLEVHIEDWDVIAVDPGSANGSSITTKEGTSYRLRPHESALLRDGAVVALSDDVSCTFQVAG